MIAADIGAGTHLQLKPVLLLVLVIVLKVEPLNLALLSKNCSKIKKTAMESPNYSRLHLHTFACSKSTFAEVISKLASEG